jgi:hypothetical protein
VTRQILLAATGEAAKSGPLGLAVILALCIVCYFLFKSMSKHLRKVREQFPVQSPVQDGQEPAKPTPTQPLPPSDPSEPFEPSDPLEPDSPGPPEPREPLEPATPESTAEPGRGAGA